MKPPLVPNKGAGAPGNEILPPEEAVEQLARVLYWKMEHLDPSDDYNWDRSREENWSVLDDHSKAFYRACISMLATESELWTKLFKIRGTRQRQLCTLE